MLQGHNVEGQLQVTQGLGEGGRASLQESAQVL